MSKPIIFVLGLSGVGKTYTTDELTKGFSLRLIDIDRKNGFEKSGFPPEWDENVAIVDFGILSNSVRQRLDDQRQGAILSFPTTYRFSRRQLLVASTYGIGVVVLWGELERCWQVRCERQKANKGTTPPRRDYLRKNAPTFMMYGNAEFDEFKVDAFQPDGTRPSRETYLVSLLERLANQGITLTAG